MELSDILKVTEDIILVPRGCQHLARCCSPSRQ